MNTLYYGDCLTIMREKMTPESVDLVYLDPPFNSKRDYNAIYKDRTGRPLPDQIDAFNDTWFLDADKMRVIRELPKLLREHGLDGHSSDFLAGFIRGLVNTQVDMAAYLAYMTERLLWIKRVMKPTASIYLHCDSTASHYLKVVMDTVFGRKNFRNDIRWGYRSENLSRKKWARGGDCIFFYSRNAASNRFSPQPRTVDESELQKLYPNSDKHGRYKLTSCQNNALRPNMIYEWNGHVRQWRFQKSTMEKYEAEGKLVYNNEGIPRRKSYAAESFAGGVMTDTWVDIPLALGSERLGYPTQKPLVLLERIITASCPSEGVVFDPFCGCATTIEAAESLGRRWIGIDITIHAIRRVARRRLQERLHLIEDEDYVIDGVPQNWEGALELWKQDPYQFQKWCVEQVEGFVNVKKTADDGIDGRIYFDMPGEKVFQSMALEVKGGQHVGIKDVRSLNSVLQFENIQMAGLITLWEPNDRQSNNFKQSMALAGDVEIEGRLYPRMQLLTVDEIVNGAKFDMPSPAGRTGTGYERDLWNTPQ